MKHRFARACATLALAVTAVAGGTAAASAQTLGSSNVGLPDLSSRQCAANMVISVPGGANSSARVPDNVPHGLYTTDVGPQLRNTTGGRVVDHYASFDSLPGGFRNYETVRNGAFKSARNLIARDAAKCPDAKFSIYGYSLGADVASLLVRDIGHGRGPIPVDRLSSAVFMASPNRGVPGVEQLGGAPGHTEGAFGALPGGYGEATDRAVDICRRGDIVCDTPHATSTVAKQLAKTAILTSHTNLGAALTSINSLSPADKLVAAPALITGFPIHIDYAAVNGTGLSANYIRSHLA